MIQSESVDCSFKLMSLGFRCQNLFKHLLLEGFYSKNNKQ